MNLTSTDKLFRALDRFQIEIPSWGFANTGTRFGKFIQPGAATTTEEKFSDAAQVHSLTGVCPSIALHVLWDLPQGLKSVDEVTALGHRYQVRPGSINPNLFQDQIYKFGSFANPMPLFAATLSLTPNSASISRKASKAATFPTGLPTARTIPARPIFASASTSSKST